MEYQRHYANEEAGFVLSAAFERWFTIDCGRPMVDLQMRDGLYVDDRTHLMALAYDTAMEEYRGRRNGIERRGASLIMVRPINMIEHRSGHDRRVL